MTFSILAYDPLTESYGGASATGNICVGGWVLRGDPLSGVSASQGSEPSTLWGEHILRLTGDGLDAKTAIKNTIKKDKGKQRRQLSVIDKKGNGSVFSGNENSSIIDELVSNNLVLSGNILSNKNVLNSMKERYLENQDKSLLYRLYFALQGGNKAGGDKRGIFSASILIVSRKSPPISLRVDYSTNPLKKLKELISKSNTKDYTNWLNSLPVVSDPYKIEKR
jgi:uncharacterized Ntn-hydrolase superfamily protein|tara:strand:- start:29 stop:697 length:669 start_codon:yes stop_codon:yes gene_type:complete